MQIITMKVPAEMAARLERAASRRRVAKSHVMREALDEKLREAGIQPSVFDLMKGELGALDSGKRDLGHNPGHLEGFGRK